MVKRLIAWKIREFIMIIALIIRLKEYESLYGKTNRSSKDKIKKIRKTEMDSSISQMRGSMMIVGSKESIMDMEFWLQIARNEYANRHKVQWIEDTKENAMQTLMIAALNATVLSIQAVFLLANANITLKNETIHQVL